MRRNSGLTLIELMVVVVIIGILATIALPSYKKYVVKSKVAEAYALLGIMTKNQITYYNENSQFYHISQLNPGLITDNMTITSSTLWGAIGYPAPIGSRTFFEYNAHAGKVDSSSTQLWMPASSTSGNGFAISANAALMNGVQGVASTECNALLATDGSLGAPSAANSDWAIVSAVGDLNNDYTSECTAIARLIESTTANGRKPGSPKGFLTFNYGK